MDDTDQLDQSDTIVKAQTTSKLKGSQYLLPGNLKLVISSIKLEICDVTT